MSRAHRGKWVLFGAVAAGGAVVASAAAFACVPFKGKATLVGTSGAATVTGSGTSGMEYCEPPGRGPKVDRAGSFTLSVRPQADASEPCVSQLAGGTEYVVSYGVQGSDNLFGNENGDCFLGNNTTAVQVGTMGVDTNGTGSGTFTLPSTVSPGPGAICVHHPAYLDGNRVPIYVL